MALSSYESAFWLCAMLASALTLPLSEQIASGIILPDEIEVGFNGEPHPSPRALQLTAAQTLVALTLSSRHYANPSSSHCSTRRYLEHRPHC